MVSDKVEGGRNTENPGNQRTAIEAVCKQGERNLEQNCPEETKMSIAYSA